MRFAPVLFCEEDLSSLGRGHVLAYSCFPCRQCVCVRERQLCLRDVILNVDGCQSKLLCTNALPMKKYIA